MSRALMLRAAAGERPDTLRISRPARAVAFGKRDTVSPGYTGAVAAARAVGLEGVERLGGGRAAVFTEHTVSLAHAVGDPDPRSGVMRRFESTARLVARALSHLGVDARVGQVEGEYCPGEHSVNARGERKLAGVGQRLVSGAAHVGAVVVVSGTEEVNAILGPVYAALGLDWRPDATGAVADEASGVTWDVVAEALRGAYAERYELEPVELDEGTLALARRLAPEHHSPG